MNIKRKKIRTIKQLKFVTLISVCALLVMALGFAIAGIVLEYDKKKVPLQYTEGLVFVGLDPSGYVTSNQGEIASYMIGNGDECSGYSGTSSEVVIPSVYKNKPVVAISQKAFYGCDVLVSISIPKSITSIENSAFSDCTKLENITFRESEISVGDHIGRRGFMIGECAFANCEKLYSIIIPNEITLLENNIFDGCIRLNSVEFEQSSNWFYIDTRAQAEAREGGVSIDVSNKFLNDSYFTHTYLNQFWYRK